MVELRRKPQARSGRKTKPVSRVKRAKRQPQTRHEQHNCIVRPVHNKGPHRYEVYCLQCKKHVQWAKRVFYDAYLEMHEQQ